MPLKEGSVKHVYFVTETKGFISSMELREIKKTKIECACKFFDEINRKINPDNVKYDVVNSFGRLMEIVGMGGKNMRPIRSKIDFPFMNNTNQGGRL